MNVTDPAAPPSILPERSARIGLSIGLAMIVASILATLLVPKRVVDEPGPHLAEFVPTRFGAWTAIQSPLEQVSLTAQKDGAPDPMQLAYDDSLLRTYTRPDGTQIMVALAYDKTQHEEDRVHRPEICYIAQGFQILSDHEASFSVRDVTGTAIEGRRMLTQHGSRLEAVSYWIRIGDTFTQNPWISRLYVLKEGLSGRVHDGMLVRVSEVIPSEQDASRSFRDQDQFLGELTNAVPPDGARMIARAS